MRGALSANIKRVHRSYYLPSMTGIATAVYENQAIAPKSFAPVADIQSDYLRHIGHQLAGAAALSGTYPFTLARSVKGFRINSFLHALTDPGKRAAFLADQETAFAGAELSEVERDMIRKRDWR